MSSQPGTAPARQVSAPPPQDAVEHGQGGRAARSLPRPYGGKDHPAYRQDGDQAEDQQCYLIPRSPLLTWAIMDSS